jgi:septal ring factor EnvC (AmiA/AmiB activator)
MAHNELNEEYDKKCKEVKLLSSETKRLKQEIISITAERNRFKMHKELMSKDFKTGQDAFMKMVNSNSSSKNFNDVVSLIFKIA